MVFNARTNEQRKQRKRKRYNKHSKFLYQLDWEARNKMSNENNEQPNFENIICNDYRSYMEVLFTANYLQHKKLPGLKVLCRSDLRGELRDELNTLNDNFSNEKDKLIVKQKFSEFIHTLKEALLISTYDLSKEHWVVQLNQLLSVFTLDKRHIDFLMILFHLELNQEIKMAIDNSDIKSFKEYFSFLESIFGFPSKHFNGILNENSALIELGIVDVNWNSANDFGDRIDIASNLIAAVNSSEPEKNLMSYFCGFEKKPKLTLASYQSYQIDAEKIKKILQKSIKTNTKGINILLYGAPGTGKTEFAKAIASDISIDLAVVENGNSGGARSSGRYNHDDAGLGFWLFSIQMCSKMAKKSGNCVLFLDDADSLLLLDDESHHRHRFSSKHRSKLLKLLEENEIPIIWVVNFNTDIDVAVKRRFTWNVEFKHPNAKERIQIWNNIINNKGLTSQLDENEIKRLAFTYEAQPAIIENSLHIGQLLSDDGIKIQDVEDSLIKSLTLINNVTKDSINGSGHCVSKNYSLDLINTSIPLQNLINSVQIFANKPHNTNRLKSICMCFMGQPGTGKTEFVKHLGAHLHKKVIFKKASDFQSMMGTIEENLAATFAEAEEEDAILFMDEVETFLFNRQNAIFSWEVAQVNEMLTQIDNFKGIFIGATNCQKMLDPACIRRFHYRVEFMPIQNNMKIATFQAFFPHITLPSEGLRSEFYKNLSKLENLCLGDFKAVAVRTQFLNFDDPFYYLKELKHEVSAKAEITQ